MSTKHLSLFERRSQRVRNSLKRKSRGRVRLSVHRSGQHIYAQIIDDATSATLASASTLDKDLRAKLKSTATIDAAREVGTLIARRAAEKSHRSGRFRPRWVSLSWPREGTRRRSPRSRIGFLRWRLLKVRAPVAKAAPAVKIVVVAVKVAPVVRSAAKAVALAAIAVKTSRPKPASSWTNWSRLTALPRW